MLCSGKRCRILKLKIFFGFFVITRVPFNRLSFGRETFSKKRNNNVCIKIGSAIESATLTMPDNEFFILLAKCRHLVELDNSYLFEKIAVKYVLYLFSAEIF